MTKNFDYVFEILQGYRDLSLFQLTKLHLDAINTKIKEKVGRITVYTLIADSFGQLAINTEDCLRHYTAVLEKNNNSGEVILFINQPLQPNVTSKDICNHQLYKMINRKIPVIENVSIIYVIKLLAMNNPSLWKLDKDMIYFPSVMYFDDFNVVPPQLSFTDEEEKMGRDLLKKMGLMEDSQYICFHNRDSLYHARRNLSWYDTADYKHQDCDIENFYSAIQYLANKGYYCLRMGKIYEKPLNLVHDHIIDYAGKYRSDFGDIYLLAKCKFLLGSSSGLSCIPFIFNVPSIVVNQVPPGIPTYIKNVIYLYKKFWYIPEKRFLKFRELLDARVFYWALNSSRIAELGIELIQNSPEEILDVTIEMLERLDNKWTDTEEDIILQKQYRSLFTRNHNKNGTYIDFPYSKIDISVSKAGALFLRKNRHLLD